MKSEDNDDEAEEETVETLTDEELGCPCDLTIFIKEDEEQKSAEPCQAHCSEECGGGRGGRGREGEDLGSKATEGAVLCAKCESRLCNTIMSGVRYKLSCC